MKEKAKKFIGPSKRMAEALEAEGLYVTWPSVIKDEGDLAIEGTFTTGEGWEKLVTIDLRDKLALGTKNGIDNAISYELTKAYEEFDVDEELKLNMEGTEEERRARGVPDAARLLEDMKEQEACLKRFSDVADAVAGGRPIPPKEDEEDRETVHITPQTAQMIVDYLRILYKNMNTLGKDDFVLIGNELCRKMGKPLVKWGK